jgi:rhamnosyltransferase subunit B
MKRIVLATFGSLGDLHPYLAVGIGLKARGHAVTIATSEIYRGRVEEEGLAFHPVRPDLELFRGNTEILRRIWNSRDGTEYLIREMMLPYLAETFEDLRSACAGADVLVTHLLLYASPMVAELLKIPLISIGLQPSALLSVYDPPVLTPARWTYHLRHLGPLPFRMLFALGSQRTRVWGKPIFELRRRLGLTAPAHDPIMQWAWQGSHTMGWFSPLFGARQPDWPPNTVITGFPFYDSSTEASLLPATEAFLQAGSPPLVFTLGSAAVEHAGNFYPESAAAAKLLGRRAILLVGEAAAGELRGLVSDAVHVIAYEPYARLFPRAAAVIHQCGIGTTSESLRAGVPILAVPWGHDQFDNSERIKRLGCGTILSRRRYTAKRVASAIQELVSNAVISVKAASIAETIRAEDGVAAACDAIERIV